MSDYERTPRPSFLKGLLFIAVIAIGVALLAFFVLSQRSSEGPLVISEKPTPLAVDVVVADVQSSLALDEKFTGIVQPRRSSDLGFADGGRIAALNVDVGDRVTDGQILAVLDTRALRSQLASAEARVNEARASHALAMNTVERQQTLLARGHVSQQRVDEALAQAATADARIEAAKAQADTLRVQIDLASITAPYPGVITARNYDEGAIAPQGAPVFALVETGSLEARIGLPATLASTLAPAARAWRRLRTREQRIDRDDLRLDSLDRVPAVRVRAAQPPPTRAEQQHEAAEQEEVSQREDEPGPQVFGGMSRLASLTAQPRHERRGSQSAGEQHDQPRDGAQRDRLARPRPDGVLVSRTGRLGRQRGDTDCQALDDDIESRDDHRCVPHHGQSLA